MAHTCETDKTYKGLEVEKEHANDTVTRAIELEEIDESVLESKHLEPMQQHVLLNYLRRTQQMNHSANAYAGRSVRVQFLVHQSQLCWV